MITPENVKYIAGLARIHLSSQEIDQLTGNLEDILGYIEKLSKLDVERVKPTSHVLSLENVYREDTPKPSLGQDDALSISVAKHKGSFKVPQVIES